MPRFAANLSMLFNEYPMMERFDRAASAGFQAVEFMFPYAEDRAALRDALTRNGLQQALFNMPPGNFAAGERGIANDPRRQAEFRESVSLALDFAALLACPKMNCMAGLTLPDVPRETQWATLAENVAYAAEQAANAGVLLVVEPINQFDIPGFFLSTPSMGFALIEQVGHPNAKVQYDIYHAQRTEGNLTATIAERIAQIGHIQIADSPKRNQPGTGEINYPFVFSALDAAGYDGWTSLEYRPAGSTEESLGWLRSMGYWT